MIYLYDKLVDFTDDMYMTALDKLPNCRREHTLKKVSPLDRKLSVLAYLLLCYGLKHEYSINNFPDFNFGEKGKPYLSDRSDIYFNISHCKKAVACAVSSKNIGIDVETVRKNIKPSVIKRVCSDEEQASLSGENAERRFITLWTMKEACQKLNGEGISADLKKITSNTDVCKNMFYYEAESYTLTCTESLKIIMPSVEDLIKICVEFY